MELSKKVGYINGLIAGLGIDKDKPEGKVLDAITDLLEEMADSIEMLDESVDDLYESVSDLEDIKDVLDDISNGTFELDDYDDDDEDIEYDDYDDDDEYEMMDDIDDAIDIGDQLEVDIGDISLRPRMKGKKPPRS